MPSMTRIPHQKHRGVPADERRQKRREKLVGAAIQVYGRSGFRQATVKSVCEAAGLTERYFYESFPNSEALLVAAFDAVATQFRVCLRNAAESVDEVGERRVQRLLDEFFMRLACDQPAARLFLIEACGVSEGCDAILEEVLSDIADLLEAAWGARTSADPLLKIAVSGGLNQMATSWIASDCARPVEEVSTLGVRLTACLRAAASGG